MAKLYVGNLPFKATEEEVKAHFETVGEVLSVNLIMDKESGRPRGFGFVEMDDSDKAITELNGKDFQGRALNIKPALEKSRGDRPYGPKQGSGSNSNSGGFNNRRY